jgi:hypothetical protein
VVAREGDPGFVGPVRPKEGDPGFVGPVRPISSGSGGGGGGIQGPVQEGIDPEIFSRTGKSVKIGSPEAKKIIAIEAQIKDAAEKKARIESAKDRVRLLKEQKSRTIAGQISAKDTPQSFIGPVRPTSSSSIEGPSQSKIGLPPTGRPSFGTIGLPGALIETGKRAIGRLAGKREGSFQLQNILSPLDATVVPKAGRAAFQIGDRGIETRDLGLLKLGAAVGLSKVSEAKFTTFGEIQKEIESGRSEKIIPEQKRQQARIDSGEISLEDATTEFKSFQQDVFKSSPDVPGITGKRRSPIRTAVDIGLSATPLTAFTAAAVSSQADPIKVDVEAIKSGTTSIAGASTQRPSLRTTGFIGAGVLGVASKGFSQQEGGILSRQAVREAEKELSGKLLVPTGPSKTIGSGPGTALIEESGIRQLQGGLSKQEIVVRQLVTEASGGRVAVPGGRAISKTQIFDPISGKIIKGAKEQFTLGTKFPLDVSTGGRAVSRSGSGINFEQEIPDILSARGTGFIKKKGATDFTEFDILGVGIKSKKGVTTLGFKEADVLLSTEEALFKETGKKAFTSEGRLVTRFQRGGTKVSPTEKVFRETGDELFGKIGEPIRTKSGAPIVRIQETGLRVRDATSFSFTPTAKNVPKLDDLFSIGPQPVRIIKGARKAKVIEFPEGASVDVVKLDIGIKTPKVSPTPKATPPTTTGETLQVLKQEPVKVSGFKESSKVASSAISGRAFDFIKPASVQVAKTTPLIGIPRAVGGGGLSSFQLSPTKQQGTLLIDKGLLAPKAKEVFDFVPQISVGISTASTTVTKKSKVSKLKPSKAQAESLAIETTQNIAQLQKPAKLQETSIDFVQTIPTFTPTLDVPSSTSGFGDFGFGGIILPKIPSLGGTGAPPKKERGRKLKQRKIKASFTAVALGIETGIPKTLSGFGLDPFAIRGLKKRKKSKKRNKK